MPRSGFSAVALPVVCIAAVSLLAGCAAQSSRRPLRTSAIESGAGSTESVRKQLEGTWILVSFQVYDAAGTARALDASGSLTYDAFGNLVLIGKIADPAAAGGHADSLAFKGRAVVDAAGQRLVLADVRGNVDPAALPATMSPDKVRYYAFQADTLSLETRDGTRVLARTVWRKNP
jgi:hypothetical protein